MTEFVNETENPMQQSAAKGKYDVKATFALNGDSQQVDLAFTADSRLTGDKNIVLVFDGNFYNGHIDCPNIDSVSGTFVVNGKTYTLEKKEDLYQPPVVNYVQINCGGIVHSFELGDNLSDVQKVASRAVSDIFGEVLKNTDKKGGKSSRKAYRKASRKAARKPYRKSVSNKKRNRGTRKK